MPTYNQASFIASAIDSVLGQPDTSDIRLTVLDGLSRDGTTDLLQRIDDTRLNWTSEKDNGQTDAINKGMRQATGDIVAWLNSDDLYRPGALATVAEAFDRHPEARWLVGDCDIIDEGGRTIREAVTLYKRRRLQRYSYRGLLRENFISQMSVFWRRGFGESLAYPNGDLLDESLYYAMDYDLWLRMGRACDPLILDRTLAAFRVHGGSKTHLDHGAQFREQYAVAKRYADGDRASLFWQRINAWKARAGYRLLSKA